MLKKYSYAYKNFDKASEINNALQLRTMIYFLF
jgi:hypothetical protein